MQDEELMFPMHRNLGVFTTRGIPLSRLFAQWQGKANGFTKGRDRSFHFGTLEYKIVGMISHLGPQLSLADGAALAYKLKKDHKASLVFTGEGGTSQGEFHEALNVAAVWDLPVIFVIENNGYGLSTPSSQQFRCEHLADKARGYGMEGITIDGNNILEVYHTISELSQRARNESKPFLVECMTFRMRGHEEASGTKYVPVDLLDEWAQKDPIHNFEQYLIQENIMRIDEIDAIKSVMKESIHADINTEVSDLVIDLQSEVADVYSASKQGGVEPATSDMEEIRFVDAISSGLRQCMERHDNLVLMGQDIADYGGVFKVTDGFMAQFGADRVRNTPLCESAILGAALGLSLEGYKSMVEMQFADFVSCGFNQIVNNFAKLNYRWNANVDVVVRMPTGGGMGAGPFHSQCNEAWFTHVPGLKVVYPSTPYDAKGLLAAAIEDPNPVMFFEHKGLYRSIKEQVPTDYYAIPLGKARIVRAGAEVTIITYGMGVQWAEKITEDMKVDAYILDLRTLLPLDYDGIAEAVKATNRVIFLHEDTMIGGIGGELSAYVSEHLFEHLDAPLARCASLDTPIPFASELEQQFLAVHRLKDVINKTIKY
jgi:2-oxoisovalerate dehydrogenase E1 component